MKTTNPAEPREGASEARKRLGSRAALWLRGHASLVGAFVAGGLAAALYVRTINFGFFGDDPTGYFRWMEGVSWIGLFTSSPGFFLRPLVFVISKLLLLIQGGYGAPAFHFVPLILHVANTVLLGVLASALSRRQTFGWLAALLFATFPLSHEAVAEFDAICHPLLTFWVLLTLVFFERGRRTGSRTYLWAVYPTMVLALLSHENGLILPVLLLAMELIYYPPSSVRELVRRPVLHYFAVPVLYLLWWLWIPKATTSTPHSLRRHFAQYAPVSASRGLPATAFCQAERHSMGMASGTCQCVSHTDLCRRARLGHCAGVAFRDRLDGAGLRPLTPLSGLGLPARWPSPVLPRFSGRSASLGLASSCHPRSRQGFGCSSRRHDRSRSLADPGTCAASYSLYSLSVGFVRPGYGLGAPGQCTGLHSACWSRVGFCQSARLLYLQ